MFSLVYSSVLPLLCSSQRSDDASSTSAAAQIVFDSVTAFFSVLCRASCLLYIPLTAGAAAVILFFLSRCVNWKKKDGREMLN